MKQKVDENIMEQRRIERLERLRFFMLDKRAPKSPMLALFATHNLLTGFFQNSNWAAAWYCLKRAMRDSWTNFTFTIQLFWWYKIRRLSNDEVEKG